MLSVLLSPLLLAAAAQTLPGRGAPPLTAQTMRSGGPVAPDQAALGCIDIRPDC